VSELAVVLHRKRLRQFCTYCSFFLLPSYKAE